MDTDEGVGDDGVKSLVSSDGSLTDGPARGYPAVERPAVAGSGKIRKDWSCCNSFGVRGVEPKLCGSGSGSLCRGR